MLKEMLSGIPWVLFIFATIGAAVVISVLIQLFFKIGNLIKERNGKFFNFPSELDRFFQIEPPKNKADKTNKQAIIDKRLKELARDFQNSGRKEELDSLELKWMIKEKDEDLFYYYRRNLGPKGGFWIASHVAKVLGFQVRKYSDYLS
jgi:hypothetical protein